MRTPAASPDHLQGGLIGEAARFYSQLTKWNDRFAGTEPYRVPHLVYVPFPFDGAVTGTVQIGTQLTLGFEIVRHAAKAEAPLVFLVSSAGVITTIADVTFYGHDQTGREVSVTGTISVNFANWGDPEL